MNDSDLMRSVLDSLPPDVRDWAMGRLMKALKWRGWDSHCKCHACRFIRDLDEVLCRHGHEVEEYT